MSSDAVTPQPDTPRPNEQEHDSLDLDPQSEPESPRDDDADAADASDPAAVNTLINPKNS